jgi:CubicO group peptidase (beta-lactamase class C family)
MPELKPTVEPLDVGLDPKRLEQIAARFDAYVADGRLAGYVATVARGGETAWVTASGMADTHAGLSMASDTVFRIYSMTKPLTAVAVMRLVEQGRLALTDEVAPIIGAFGEPSIFVGGDEHDFTTVPSSEPIRIWHLLTHTAGLTYGFQYSHVVDALDRRAGYEWGWPPGTDLAKGCEDLSSVPLLFEPGEAWNYSMGFDVLGRVIECVTGEALDVALDRLVLEPLGMTETGFFAPEPLHERLAQLYVPDPGDANRAIALDALGALSREPPSLLGGGGGLVSTPHDYKRFTGMLLGGGELEGSACCAPRRFKT